jgi:uncharacterized protein YndB with AHSA1/START domain
MSMTERLSAPFVIEQFIKAPRELVYAAFTQGEHLSQWMRPPGMVMTQCEVDAREGGSFHYGMRAEAMPQAPAMWGKWSFRELAPERMVVVVQFSDAAGGVTRHPMAPQWPLYPVDHHAQRKPAARALHRRRALPQCRGRSGVRRLSASMNLGGTAGTATAGRLSGPAGRAQRVHILALPGRLGRIPATGPGTPGLAPLIVHAIGRLAVLDRRHAHGPDHIAQLRRNHHMGMALVLAQLLAQGQRLAHLRIGEGPALRLPDRCLALGLGIAQVENSNAHGLIFTTTEPRL